MFKKRFKHRSRKRDVNRRTTFQKVIKKGGNNEEKNMKKSIQKKGRKTERPPTTRPGAGSLPLGPGGHTNQQDRIQSIRGKTKIISLGEILKGEVLKGEVLKVNRGKA